jgi:hypothetical protein
MNKNILSNASRAHDLHQAVRWELRSASNRPMPVLKYFVSMSLILLALFIVTDIIFPGTLPQTPIAQVSSAQPIRSDAEILSKLLPATRSKKAESLEPRLPLSNRTTKVMKSESVARPRRHETAQKGRCRTTTCTTRSYVVAKNSWQLFQSRIGL